MDRSLFTSSLDESSGPSRSEHAQGESLRCGICERRLRGTICYIEETGAVADAPQSWLLCADCNEAVREQIDQSPVQSPLRIRVAVGLVATERTPAARRAHFGQLTDITWERFIFWSFVAGMAAHFAVMIFVASLLQR